MFGLVERFITAKVLEVSHEHWLGDQVALEALVRFSDEELKHQELFRRLNDLVGATLPAGYRFDVHPDAVAGVVLSKSPWAVLALTLDIERCTQLHYRHSIEPDDALSALFKDVFLYHWKEESQHAILDELEWKRHAAGLTVEARDRAVDEEEGQAIAAGFLKVSRWQYIHSGAAHPLCRQVLSSLIPADQGQRIQAARATWH